MAFLLLAKTLLIMLPFRRLAGLLESPLGVPAGVESTEECRRNIRWALETAAGVLPGQTTCFPKAIAAHVMCRMRGIPTKLLYGARISEDGRLKAHVWTQDRLHGVIGHSLAREYVVVAEFPAGSL